MTTHLLLESAFRSFIMGAILFAALRLLRIRQVRAQRTAWLLALVAALAMPAAVWLRVGPRLLPDTLPGLSIRRIHSTSAAIHISANSWLANAANSSIASTPTSLPVRTKASPNSRASSDRPTRLSQPAHSSAIQYSLLLYFSVAGFLFLRLMVGLGLAFRLRQQAFPLHAAFAINGAGDIRISSRIAAPVTVASTILLPPASAQWELAKLSIVLKHEQSHVQRADFYLLLLAGAHCAIFWFSPFSWWLQKQLSELGEALSDHAALEVAESRTAYAETLLEFASAGRWPLTAVAMARSSSLRSRIERLLSDNQYTESFSEKRRLPLFAAGLVVLAAAASTSLVRVHAAETPAARQATEPVAPSAAPQAPQAPPSALTAEAPAPLSAKPDTQDSYSTGTGTSTGNGPSYSTGQGSSSSPLPPKHTHTDVDLDSSSHGFSYAYNNDGDAFALVTGSGESQITFSGSFNDRFQRIRANTPGEFIYYRHDGKAYVIQDSVLLARAKSLYAPMQDLGRRQEILGRQQQALGLQQKLAAQRAQSSIATPDFKKELESLNEATEQLKRLQSQPTIDRLSLAEVQARIGEIQATLGELQGQAGEKQGQLGEKQGRLGEQQGKLGEEQGRLGEQQGKISEDAQRQLKPLIEQAIRDGRAKPVD